ncbi:MAG: heavy metal translocating P-type ATPase, partial [Clostridia bacterium]
MERVLSKVDGVNEAVVILAQEKLKVKYDKAVVSISEMEKAVDNIGYEITLESVNQDEDKDDLMIKEARKKMFLVWLVTIPAMLWMLPGMFFGYPQGWPLPEYHNIGMIILAIFALAGPGRVTITSGIKAIINKVPNMDSLIALGTTAAFSTGIMHYFVDLPNFAGVATMIMAFHLTGRYIEIKARGRASQAIKKLLELGAKSAIILKDGKEVEVPIEQVDIGDVMVVKPGSSIPTDGEIVYGKSAIDESMVTGESMPVTKSEGEEVIGATVNQEGLIHVRATRVGKDTFLSQVIKMVEDAQGTKVPIQEFADKVTSVFVPIVIGLAIITFSLWAIFPNQMVSFFAPLVSFLESIFPWTFSSELGRIAQAIYAMVAVLVIACPCALGLATPTALMVGSGMGAQAGILFRDGAAIQQLQKIKTIVFDKTGTITKGKPEVTDLVSYKVDKEKLLQYAASAEQGSEHPIANSIVQKAKDDNVETLELDDFETFTGRGIKAVINKSVVYVGNLKLMKENNIDVSEFEEFERLENEAKTVVAVAIDSEFSGVIAVADAIKDDSFDAIKELKEMGIKTVMLTGDNKRTAKAIAKMAGIEQVVAEVLPDGKVKKVKELQQSDGLVAMVGDGINDAPALTQADVGMAIGTGTDIAIEASDVTLVQGSLLSVISAIKLSKSTFRKIKQNLFWAFIYNLVAVPLAISGILHPAIA